MQEFEDITLFCLRRLQQEPLIKDQYQGVGIFCHYLLISAVSPSQLQVDEQIGETDVSGIEVLLTGLHAERTSHVGLAAACCTGDEQVPVFSDIFAGGKTAYELLVLLAPGCVIDIHDTCIRLVESGIFDQPL